MGMKVKEAILTLNAMIDAERNEKRMSVETYTSEQFMKSLTLRGYMGPKMAKRYVEEHPKEVWLESDFEKVYDDINREPMRSKPIKGLSTNGKNLFAPESMK